MQATFELARRCGAPVPYSSVVTKFAGSSTGSGLVPEKTELCMSKPFETNDLISLEYIGPIAGLGPGMVAFARTPYGKKFKAKGAYAIDYTTNASELTLESARYFAIPVFKLKMGDLKAFPDAVPFVDITLVLLASALAKWSQPHLMDDVGAMFGIPKGGMADYDENCAIHSSMKTMQELADPGLWRVPEREDLEPVAVLGSPGFDGLPVAAQLAAASAVFSD
jgi:hypothetical protein